MSYRRRKSWHMHALTPASLEQIPKKLAHLIFKSDSFFREFFFQQRINLHATCCEERNFFNGSSLRASLVLQQRSKPHFYLHLRARASYIPLMLTFCIFSLRTNTGVYGRARLHVLVGAYLLLRVILKLKPSVCGYMSFLPGVSWVPCYNATNTR